MRERKRTRPHLSRAPHDLALLAAATAILLGAAIVVSGPMVGGDWQSSWVPNWAVSLWATAATIVVLDVVIGRRTLEAQQRIERERLAPLRWLASRDLRRVSRKLVAFLRGALLSLPEPHVESDLTEEQQLQRKTMFKAPLGSGYDAAFASFVFLLGACELDDQQRKTLGERLLPHALELQRELDRLTDIYIATGALTEGQISGIGMLANTFHYLSERLSRHQGFDRLTEYELCQNYLNAGRGVERHGSIEGPDASRGGNFRDAFGIFKPVMSGSSTWNRLLLEPPRNLDEQLLRRYWLAVRHAPVITTAAADDEREGLMDSGHEDPS